MLRASQLPFAFVLLAVLSSGALAADVVPGTQNVAPAGGVTVQQGVDTGKPVPCADNTPRNDKGQCPTGKTVTQSGPADASPAAATPSSSIK